MFSNKCGVTDIFKGSCLSEINATIVWAGDLKQRKRKHTREKPFNCGQCSLYGI